MVYSWFQYINFNTCCEFNTSRQPDVVSEANEVEGRQYSRMTERSGVVVTSTVIFQ
ncbi:hypothetical protein AZ007_000280 [Citrobacter freundii]|nr:hypothetical protein AZ007_000280 [Citrobacter freundii]